MWRPCVLALGVKVTSPNATHALAASPPVLLPRQSQKRLCSKVIMNKTLQKMIDKRKGTKKKWFPTNFQVSETEIKNRSKTKKKGPAFTEGQKRRAHQVGRVLYDRIVQLVNSGELSPRLAELAVDIYQVKVVPDFGAVNVYWLCSGSARDDEEVETLLKQKQGYLRQLLISEHVLGQVPAINFVRDESRARYLQVEALLEQADFGPDFVPTRLDTSVRKLSKAGLEKSHPEPNIQADFQQMRISTSLECFTNELAPTNGKETHSTPDNASVQPSSLEVNQLADQFFKDSVNSAPSSKKGESELDPDKWCEGFRDNLYGVPHTALMNKILSKKLGAGTRPNITTGEDYLQLKTEIDTSQLKALLKKKKWKAKEEWNMDRPEVFLESSEPTLDNRDSYEDFDDRSIDDKSSWEDDIDVRKR